MSGAAHLLRRTWFIALPTIGLFLLMTAATTTVAASQDASCLKTASRERSDSLTSAYDKYAERMKDAADNFADAESSAADHADNGFMQAEMDRANANFSYESQQNWQDLSSKIQEAWNTYAQKRNSCGYGGSVSPPILPSAPVLPPVWQYPYPIPYPGYGGYYGQPVCRQSPLPAVPFGCGYECTTDRYGCQSCHAACRNNFGSSPCVCPQYYSPVCGKDGVTYPNGCYAQCHGIGIRYGGQCDYR